MRVQYIITIKTNSTSAGVAATHFMTKVFELVEESHLSSEELNIVREELPEETLKEAIERVCKKKE